MFKLKVLLPALFLFCKANAVTYYVSGSGNNNNNGLSQQSAFNTLQHASDLVSPGDSVVVMAGFYSGFYHTTSGTASQRIVFKAMPGAVINAPNGTTNDGINLEGSSYVTIDGFEVNGVPRAGIRSVINEGIVIRNNKCDQNGVWGILTGFSEGIVIENNECSRSIQQHGIYFSNSADNPIIRNNICWGNNDCGIHMNGDLSMGGDGIISNALVEKNIIYDNGLGGGSAINCDGVQNSIIQNNLLYNNHASGISLYQIDGGAPSSDNVVVNNTILQPSDGRWALNVNNGSTGTKAFNNIFYSAHSFRGSISVDAASLPGFKSNNNIVTNRMSNDGGSTNMTFAQWQQQTQADSNSVIAVPAALFVNVSADNYHLLANSVAVNTGRNSYHNKPAPLVDIENNTRPQGPSVDIGAYEFLGTTGVGQAALQTQKSFSENDKVIIYDLAGKIIYSGVLKDFYNKKMRVYAYVIASADGMMREKKVGEQKLE